MVRSLTNSRYRSSLLLCSVCDHNIKNPFHQSDVSVLAVPTTVTYFTMYEQLKVMLDNSRRSYLNISGDHNTPGWVSLTAGGLARWFAVTIVNPLELIRTKMQSQKMPWSQVTKCLRELVSSQGVRGLWNGYTATLLRDVPFSALYWPLYELTRNTLRDQRDNLQLQHRLNVQENSFLVNFVSGGEYLVKYFCVK